MITAAVSGWCAFRFIDSPWTHAHPTEKQAILAEARLEERLRGALELIKEQVGRGAGGVRVEGGLMVLLVLFHACIDPTITQSNS